MRTKFIKAFSDLQELFQELNDQGKISPDQADRFNNSQKEFINYDFWLQNSHQEKLKVDLPWKDECFKEMWIEWKKYLREKYVFNYIEASERITLEQLHKMSIGDVNKAIEIIKQSIGAGWKRFYDLQTDKYPQKKKGKPGQILTTDNAKEYDGWDD